MGCTFCTSSDSNAENVEPSLPGDAAVTPNYDQDANVQLTNENEEAIDMPYVVDLDSMVEHVYIEHSWEVKKFLMYPGSEYLEVG